MVGARKGVGATGRLVGLLSEGLKTKVGADGARQVAQRACHRADVRQPSARVHALTWYSEGVDPRPWTATLPPARTWQTRRPASAQGGVLAPRSRQRPAARSCGKGCFPERSSRQSQATPSAAGGRAVAACIPLSPVSRRIKTICMGSFSEARSTGTEAARSAAVAALFGSVHAVPGGSSDPPAIRPRSFCMSGVYITVV
jgi:hypothetical protein